MTFGLVRQITLDFRSRAAARDMIKARDGAKSVAPKTHLQAGHGLRSEPGIPCALSIERTFFGT
jgi:hypothetical protein